MGEETKTDQNDDASRSNQEESSSHHAHLQQQTGSSGVPTIPQIYFDDEEYSSDQYNLPEENE
jgi:hypothetical protein